MFRFQYFIIKNGERGRRSPKVSYKQKSIKDKTSDSTPSKDDSYGDIIPNNQQDSPPRIKLRQPYLSDMRRCAPLCIPYFLQIAPLSIFYIIALAFQYVNTFYRKLNKIFRILSGCYGRLASMRERMISMASGVFSSSPEPSIWVAPYMIARTANAD